MSTKSDSILKSGKRAGLLWLLAGLLMMVPPILLDGNRTLVGVGAMFLILGLVSLGRDRKT